MAQVFVKNLTCEEQFQQTGMVEREIYTEEIYVIEGSDIDFPDTCLSVTEDPFSRQLTDAI